ncbi:unnamed protein product [Ixodes pacificus]
MYEAVALSEFCHVSMEPPVVVTAHEQGVMAELLLRAAPQSAIAQQSPLYYSGRCQLNPVGLIFSAVLAAPVPLMTLLHREATSLDGKSFGEVLLLLCQVYGTDLAVSQVEAATRSQATSPTWHTYRKGLVTASIGHTCFTKARAILQANTDVNVAPLLSLILRSNPVSTPAMRAGVEKEGPANKLYIEKLRAVGHEASIEEVGLLLLKDFPLEGVRQTVLFHLVATAARAGRYCWRSSALANWKMLSLTLVRGR